jgi:Protein of unknown function (DUF3592)
LSFKVSNWFDSSFSYEAADGERRSAQPRELRHAITIMLVLAAFFVLWAGFERYRFVEHYAAAVSTTGTISNKWSSRRWFVGRRRGSINRRQYYVKVGFDTAEKVHYDYTRRLARYDWERTAVGDRIAVWYVPSNPANHAIRARGYPSSQIEFDIIAAGFVVIAGWFGFEYLATRSRKRGIVRPNTRARSAYRSVRSSAKLYRPMQS